MEYYHKKQGTASSGQQYEIILLMTYLLEAEGRKKVGKLSKFRLASNIVEGQCFDDLVLRYEYTNPEGQLKSFVTFIQSKHREHKNKNKGVKNIFAGALLSEEGHGDFALKKYVSSFCRIKHLFSHNSDHPLFNGNIEDCEFIICTNATFSNHGKEGVVEGKPVEEEHFLKAAGKEDNKYYKLSDNHKVKECLKVFLDYELLTYALAQLILPEEARNENNKKLNNGIIRDYFFSLSSTILKKMNKYEYGITEKFFDEEYKDFRNDIVNELKNYEEYSELDDDKLKEIILEARIKRKNFDKSEGNKLKLTLPKKYISDEDFDTFKDRLKIFTGLHDISDFKKSIKKRIEQFYRRDRNDVIFLKVQEQITDWWTNGEFYLKEDHKYFQQASSFSITFDGQSSTTSFKGRREKLTDLHRSLQRNQNETKLTMTVISGLGGIGKTELARRYVEEYGGHYDNTIIWINAENDSTIEESFFRLAKDVLEIPTTNSNTEPKDKISIIEKIFADFSDQKSLFVFDNLEECTDFDRIIKFSSLKAEDHRPYILVTSRNRRWKKDVEVIELYGLEVKEAIDLFIEDINISKDLDEDDIKELVNKLQCFPLAIRQAASFINYECDMRHYTIADYLKQFEKKSKILLNAELRKGIDFKGPDSYSSTTYKTWRSTINGKILKNLEGPLALKLLSIMGFISHENIIRDMFVNLENVKKDRIRKSVHLLISYCLINGEDRQSILNIHKLVQEVIRIHVTKGNYHLRVVQESCVLLKKYFVSGNRQTAFPHLETLLQHVDRISCINKYLHPSCLQDILRMLYDGSINNRRYQAMILKRIYELQKKKCHQAWKAKAWKAKAWKAKAWKAKAWKAKAIDISTQKKW